MLSDLELFSPKYNKADVHLHAILTALRRDYEQGQVRTFEELVHAALFDDFEAQAEYLLDEGYLLPATVIAGATLEEHLRQLATKNSIAITMTDAKGKVRPRKAAELNDDLYKAKGYSQPEWRQLQAWLVLRNEAAHGKPEFAGRTDGDIRPMIESIRAFIARYPA
ncbi:MAG: hypothetical protein DYH12_14055 [Sorangiineae bacterium PRO1]|nr:hypothetical protein [Sorangiineae bacterium PRO1]